MGAEQGEGKGAALTEEIRYYLILIYLVSFVIYVIIFFMVMGVPKNLLSWSIFVIPVGLLIFNFVHRTQYADYVHGIEAVPVKILSIMVGFVALTVVGGESISNTSRTLLIIVLLIITLATSELWFDPHYQVLVNHFRTNLEIISVYLMILAVYLFLFPNGYSMEVQSNQFITKVANR